MKKPSAIFVAGALLLASCSSGSTESEITTGTLFPATTTSVVETDRPVVTTTTSTIAPVMLESVPLVDYAIPEYTAENDTFSFENFGGGEAPADLTVNMARRLYGDNQVCSDVTDNKCTPYPVILQLMSQANKSMRGGLCEGLAVLSMRLSGDIETLASFQNTTTVAELIKEDPALLSEIAYWYVTQFAMEVQQEASSYLELSPTALAEILLYDFAEAEQGNPYTGFTIGIYSDKGGHAVTPYRVEEMASGYRIYIYDSNWPGEERWIDVSKDGTWIYALAATNPTEQSEAWSGGVGTMELTPMRARTGPFTCSFCPQEEGEESGTMLTVAASGSKQMALKIETESGQRLGYYDGAFVNEIPGATYRYLISGPSTSDPVLVFLPPGIETFSADVEEIAVPGKDEPVSTKDRIEDAIEEVVEQKFSLLVLNEEKSVQIEAVIVEEEEPERWEQPDDESEEEQSLLDFSEESIEIAEIEEATVAIAVDSLEVEVELDTGQQIELVFDSEPEISDELDMMDISIQDNEGELLAEVEVDLSAYRAVAAVEEPTTTTPDQPSVTIPTPEPVVVPVIIEIAYNEEIGEIVQEEEVVEAWVASDAEYYQAVAEDRIEEVLGESYVEEIQDVSEWEAPEEFDDTELDMAEIILSVDEEYWEDEQWDEVDYDDEWFEEQEDEVEEFFAEAVELEVVVEFIEEHEEELATFFINEEVDEEEFWDAYEEEYYEEDFAFQEYDAELEEEMILEEFGLEEWNEDLLGPAPTETEEWTEEDWNAYDEEMDEIWEEEMEDPEAWEEELLEELGVEEWDPDWGPSPTESADWTEDDWDAYDQEWATDEEQRILEEEGLEEWPEDWGPSPSETALWTESDWIAYDEEQELLWEVENETDTNIAVEEDWLDEDWLEEEVEVISEIDFGLEDELVEEEFLEMLSELSEDELDDWEDFIGDEEEEEWYNEEDSIEEELEDIDEEEWNQEPGEDGDETWWGDDESEDQEEEGWLEGAEEEVEDWDEDYEEDLEDSTEEDVDSFDEEFLPESDLPSEEEVDEEQVDETEMPPAEEDEERGEELDEEVEEEWEEESEEIFEEDEEEEWEWENEGSTSDEGDDQDDSTWDESDLEDGAVEEESWDPYEQCRGTSACDSAPGGYETWDDYDQANDPGYYDDWGDELPSGYATWADFAQEVEIGVVSADVAAEYLPEEVQEAIIPVVVVVEEVYYPTVSYTYEDVSISEILSTNVSTAQTGTATSSVVTATNVTGTEVTAANVTGTEVSTDMTAVLSRDANDGHWHTWETTVTTTETTTETTTQTTTETTTATTVTNTLVDTTTVVGRTGSDMTTCTFYDGVNVGCSTARGWSPETTTVTVGDPYTEASTTTATADVVTTVTADVVTTATSTASQQVEQGCSEGGWTGMGDWCIVSSSSRTDYDYIQFTLDEPTSIRIDAETNLTRAQFNTNNEAGDPYIYLNWDTHAPEGNHSGDASAVGVGQLIESDDDGGNDCGNTCLNPPSTAVDVDETPHVIRCEDAGTDCSDWPDLPPVIDNVSDQWDSRIVRTNQAAGNYVVRGSVYNGNNDGWYRLTIEEVE